MSINEYTKQKGFTLLEVLISLVIAGMLIVLTSQMLAKILQYTQKAQIRSQVSQDMQYAVEVVKRNLRQTDYSLLGNSYTGFPGVTNNRCATVTGEVALINGEGCGVRLVQNSYYPVFYLSNDALYYTDAQGTAYQVSPDTVVVSKVVVSREDIPAVNPQTAYIQIKLTIEDRQGVLQSYGSSDAELVNIDTGVFIRKFD